MRCVNRWSLSWRYSAVLIAFSLTCLSNGAVAQQPTVPTGRIAGTIVDASTGRPVTGAVVELTGTNVRAVSDVNGHYRTIPVPSAFYTVRVTMISYAPVRVDSVRVAANTVVTLPIGLQPQAIQLEAIVATVTGQRAASSAGLLAVQKNAPGVMDGISAEQMSRSPDSNAADAISRVTGVSVVDDKFVVVRGLTERYSNTLLNGVELASPEPTRRVVPLDIFPAALLESIVAVKTATPDLPGDFAGGSVNIQTKDFPEQRVLELKVSQGYNSLTTLKQLPVFSRNGLRDLTGFDGADRTIHPPSDFNIRQTRGSATGLAKSVRDVWTAAPHSVRPDMGLTLQYGDQLGEFQHALGYVFSFDYGYKTGYEPNEYFAVVGSDGGRLIENTTQHSSTTADWGVLGNATLRLGPSNTFGIKNLLTQESEEFVVIDQAAYNAEQEGGFGPIAHRYQVRYLERSLRQSQLRGEHHFTWPFRTLWRWNLTESSAKRDEPENRTLTYMDAGGTPSLSRLRQNYYWFRFLDDNTRSGNVDLSIPVNWFGKTEALFKFGAGDRRKHRNFDGYRFSIAPVSGFPPDGVAVYTLPPELALAPENLGRNLEVTPELSGGLPYTADDEVQSAYAMADLPLGRVRIVGGLRAEKWLLNMVNHQAPAGKDSVATRNEPDLLPSLNFTLRLNDAMNLRAAGYITVSRPDPREIAYGVYVPVAGQCTQTGSPTLNRAKIMSGDLRWEMYPAPGEIISVSGFYKLFDKAIVQYIALAETTCVEIPLNARNAYSAGGEIELRKNLGFLLPALGNVFAGINVTYALGGADLILGNIRQTGLPLQDLLRYLGNGSLAYINRPAGFEATVLYNYFSDRVSFYGDIDGNGGKNPDIMEQARGMLDFKVSKRLRKVTASLSGKNLTNEIVRESQMTSNGPAQVGLAQPGVSFFLSFGYVF